MICLQELKNKILALCIDAGEHEGIKLFEMKIYEHLPEPDSEADGFLWVIDKEGEPYYYDAKGFLKSKPVQNGLSIPFDLYESHQ